MAVQFILGRSGTGKTARCYADLVAALRAGAEKPLLLLVPEQATYQAERAILSDARVTGYHRLQVVSFNRLQFFLAGRSTATPRLSSLGRQMMVHKVLRDSRDQLRVFRGSASLPGFAREIAHTITELHRYAQRPEDLAALEGRLRKTKTDPLAVLKFADLSRIFTGYTDALGDRFVDPEAQIHTACSRVADAGFLRGARLWVDGFAGFTGAEMALLGELLKVVDEARIALCLDPDALGPKPTEADGLFEPTGQTYGDLCTMLRDAGIELRKPILLTKAMRFGASRPLAHLERDLFRFGATSTRADGAVRLVAAASLRAEVQFVAGQVRRLVQEQGYRYRDIAVVASDLGQYEHYVRAYFGDHAIPFFIDQRRPLTQHPAVELIAAALQTVVGGFKHADVFAYLKTDLVPVAARDVDVLENYCLAFGVDGRDWRSDEPWQFQGPGDQEFDEKQIETIRRRAGGALLDLAAALRGGDDAGLTPADFTAAIFALLETLGVRKTLARWIDQAHAAGDPATADAHRQFYDKLIDIFDELATVFGHATMAAEDYLAIVEMAFAQMTLAFIPPSLDQVLVGSIERSRHPNLRAIFLIGATQKQFPIPVPTSGVLTDADREAAEAAGFHLAPPTTQSLVERQYLAYIAFTRPSEFLCVSYPAADEKGAPVVRSHFVDELAALFDDLTEESIDDGRAELDQVYTSGELAELLCTRLGRDAFAPAAQDKHVGGLLAALQADDDTSRLGETVTTALDYDNHAALRSAVVTDLFGKTLSGSATRLATFAACPFKYFVRYTLALQPRREFKLQPLDLGNFYHGVLDALHKRLIAEGQSFATADDEQLVERLREEIETFATQNAFIAKFRARSPHNAFIIANAGEVLEACVLEIAEMTRAGAFAPLLSEVPFGGGAEEDTGLGRFELTLADGGTLALRGKIDRLDVAEIDGQRVALVFDYKRSEAAVAFSWPHFYHGLDVQLPLYLLALAEIPDAPAEAVAGAFCLPVEQAPSSASFDDLAEKAEKFGRKAKGLFDGTYAGSLDPQAGSRWSRYYNFAVTSKDGAYGYYGTSGALRPEDFQRVLKFTKDKIVALAGDIMAGRVEVWPYRLGTEVPCSYCDYRAVCRFDWQVNDYHHLASKGKLDVCTEK